MRKNIKIIPIVIVIFVIFFNQNCFRIQKKNCFLEQETFGSNSIKAQKILLVVAHQDDEVFILSRLIKHLENGADVKIVWTSHSISDGEDYRKQRISESKNAMGLIGISLNNLCFLNLPDGETYKYPNEIKEKLEDILLKYKPSIVYIPAYEGGHIDHDICHFITVRSIKILGLKNEIIEFPLYNAYESSIFPFRIRSIYPGLDTVCNKLSESEFKYVKEIWDIYKSQHSRFGLFMDLTIGIKKTFGYEFYRDLPLYDYTKPPVNGKIAYEKYLNASFNDFLKVVKKF